MTTRWQEIARTLRSRIEDTTYEAGSHLPPIPDLMEEFGVARDTVRDAVHRLANEGLVTPLRGIGTVVRDITPVRTSYSVDAPAQTWAMQTGEAATADRTIDAGFQLADADVRERLGLPEGSQVVYRVRHFWRGGQIAQMVEQWIPDYIAAAIQNATGDDLADPQHQQSTDIYSQMAAAGYPPAWDRETICSRMPDPDEAATLQLPAGVPVQLTYRVTTDRDQEPIETATFVAASDRMYQTYTTPLHYAG